MTSGDGGSRGNGAHAGAPRVVSLISSATEIVAGLGLTDRLVGISHECDRPPEVLGLPRLSEPKVDPARASADIDLSVREIVRDGLSVYRIDVDRLQELEPDVILTQDHCEVCAVSLGDLEDALCRVDLPDALLCSLHPGSLDDVRADFRRVAGALGEPARGERLVEAFDARLNRVAAAVSGRPRPRVALVEWLDPPMVAGAWMPELARIAGGEPVVVEEPGRFRQVDWATVASADPDVVVVTPCGFDVPRTLEELDATRVRDGLRSVRAAAEGGCWLLDGNALFNRPGPGLADSAEVLAAVLHPDVFGDPEESWPGLARRWTADAG